ncbi:MAG: cysteine desulfurase [Erysipelotrichaceae bacterium]|nr:cysteine desulfurase [Erysipelotrichaceae bacterium]
MFDVKKVRNDFAMIRNHPDLIYFDNGATSFKPDCVLESLMHYYTHCNSNIHRGDYDISFEASNMYEATREAVKNFLNARKAEEIVFTAGDTASLNTIAYGYAEKYLKEGDAILSSEVEHASDILPWYVIAEKTKAKIVFAPVKEDGRFDLQAYEECLRNNRVRFVALTYVSNVLGYIYPVKEICALAHRYGAVVCIDGAQAVPHLPIDVQDLDMDFLTFSSHKMCGPEGVGVLYGKKELLDKMDPLFQGGGANARFDAKQNVILKETPYKFEAGTPNVSSVIALKDAIGYLQGIGMEELAAYEYELASYFLKRLEECDNVIVYNPHTDTGIVSFNIKGVFSQDAATYFNSKNIAVRTGNHCAKMLVDIIGVGDTIRASFYFYNTKEEIDRFIDVIKETTLEKCIEVVL